MGWVGRNIYIHLEIFLVFTVDVLRLRPVQLGVVVPQQLGQCLEVKLFPELSEGLEQRGVEAVQLEMEVIRRARNIIYVTFDGSLEIYCDILHNQVVSRQRKWQGERKRVSLFLQLLKMSTHVNCFRSSENINKICTPINFDEICHVSLFLTPHF